MTRRDLGRLVGPGLLLVALLTALGLAGAADYRDEQATAERYCQGLALWQQDAQRGIDPYDRRGHPDYQLIGEHCPAATSLTLGDGVRLAGN